MIGRYHVRVNNNRNSYSFELVRNITVLRGLSGRGKTTLFEMIHEHNRFGKNSGVSISCDKKLYALGGDNWEEELAAHPGEIIVIDEDSQFIRSKDFARAVRGSDNYYLLITRNYLADLPISVDEIYELTGAKNKKFKRVYQDLDRMYDRPSERNLPFAPDVIVTEDSKAGYQFFCHIAQQSGMKCISASGKTKVFRKVCELQNENVIVIADGAAFGAEIDELVKQQQLRPQKLAIYLPESFEWLVLSSGVVDLSDEKLLAMPELFADSTQYMSYEQYFTELLSDETRKIAYMKYRKEKLADYYVQEQVSGQIKKQMKWIQFGA